MKVERVETEMSMIRVDIVPKDIFKRSDRELVVRHRQILIIILVKISRRAVSIAFDVARSYCLQNKSMSIIDHPKRGMGIVQVPSELLITDTVIIHHLVCVDIDRRLVIVITHGIAILPLVLVVIVPCITGGRRK